MILKNRFDKKNALNGKDGLSGKYYSGFSLVELLIVMAITGTLLGLGIITVINLRQRTVMKSTVNEFIDTINAGRNEARNSSVDLGGYSGPDGPQKDDYVFNQSQNLTYKGVGVLDETFSLGDCLANDTALTNFNCSLEEQKSQTSQPVKVTVSDPAQYLTGNDLKRALSGDTCRGMIFYPGTGAANFATIDPSDTDANSVDKYENTDKNICVYEFTHELRPNSPIVLKVDLEFNDFELI